MVGMIFALLAHLTGIVVTHGQHLSILRTETGCNSCGVMGERLPLLSACLPNVLLSAALIFTYAIGLFKTTMLRLATWAICIIGYLLGCKP